MRLVVRIEGSIITEILSEEAAEVVILDSDIEGLDEDDLTLIDDEMIYAYKTTAMPDPKCVNKIFQQVDEQHG